MLAQTNINTLQVSRHDQLALISAALPLCNWLDAAGRLTDLNPIVPLHGGRQVYVFRKDKQSDTPRRKIERLTRLEMETPLQYGVAQRLRLICQKTTSQRRESFTLAGPLTSFDHALLMTAFAGVPSGTDLRYFGLKGSFPRCFNLEQLILHGPVLCDTETGDPVLSNTMTPFLEQVADFIRHSKPVVSA